MKKIVSLVAVLALSMTLLTGCVGSSTNITINSDGSGTFMTTTSLDMDAMGIFDSDVDLFIEELENSLEEDTYDIVKYDIDHTTYVGISSEFDFSDANELIDALRDEGYQDVYVRPDCKGIRFTGGVLAMFSELGAGNLFGITTKDLLMDNTILDGVITTSTITLDKDIIRVSEGGRINGKSATFTFEDEENYNPEIMVSAEAELKAPVLVNVKDGATYTKPKTITAQDESGIKSIKYTLNGGDEETLANGTQINKNGVYDFTVSDYYDNTTTFQVTYTDTKAPTISGVKNGSLYRSTRYIYTEDASGISHATYSKNGAAAVKLSDPEDITISKTGYYTVKAYDVNNNVKTVSFRIDKEKPTITGVKNKAKYTKAVYVKYKDNYKVKSATLNGKSFKSGKKVYKKGLYKVVVKDTAGNSSTVTFRIK